MIQQLEVLGGEYAVILDHCDAEGLIAHIHHIDRSGRQGFGTVATPVGYLMAHIHPGTPEIVVRCWAIDLFFRSDVRYEQASHTTTVVTSPERQAGKNQPMLQRLISLRDSSLPSCHPELPQAIGRALLDARLCHEPAGVIVHHYTSGAVIHFGHVYDDE